MPTVDINPRKCVLDAIHKGVPDAVPAGICLGGSWPIIQSNAVLHDLIGDPLTTAQIFHDVHESINADLVIVGTGATALLCRALGGEIVFRNDGAPDITSEHVTDHKAIQNLSIEAAMNDESVLWLRHIAEELVVLNQNKRAVFASGRSAFSLAAHLTGLERLSRSLYKDPVFAQELLDFTTELSINYFKMMLDVDGIDGMFIADPTASGDVISRKHYARFAMPGLSKDVKVAKDLGKASMVHICGDITDRLDLIADSGVDCISLDYKVNLIKARELVGNRVSLAGNVNPVNVLQFGNNDDVRCAAESCLKDGAENGSFILLPGCDIASGVTASNLRVFVETAHNWKG